MNYVKTDIGDMAFAEGAPGSIARVRVQYPRLIEHLRKMRVQGMSAEDAQFVMAAHGINSQLERNSLQAVASYPPNTHPLDIVPMI